jgi:serine/threonine protein kinase
MDELETIARKICVRRDLKFVKRVGEGAFKQTFSVIDSKGGALALKLYKAVSTSGRDAREIRAMKRCQHPNIARLLSMEAVDHKGHSVVAIIEEFLPGGTLTSKGQLTISQCLNVGAQLISAIAHLEQLRLVHRDIKPDNIMFRADGQTPVLTDFGVVRDLSDSSITPTWADRGPGTPFFSAPEQLRNEKNLIDWRTDQFALGIVLSQAALGDHPFRETGASDIETVERVSFRGRPASWFVQRAAEFRLGALLRMVSPWPVDRYRRPEILQSAWHEQKG